MTPGKQFQPHGFDVFAGSESFLLRTMRGGEAGCISARANINPTAIRWLYASWRNVDAPEQRQRLNVVRSALQKHSLIPALKSAIAHWSGVHEWSLVRPPLVSLDEDQARQLIADPEAIGFDMSRVP